MDSFEPGVDPSVPSRHTGHRCPECGANHAERRTARNVFERAAAAVIGYYPYRCLECDRRFFDRPSHAGTRGGAEPAAERAIPEPPAATVESATEGTDAKPSRRPRWIVDPGDTPLDRSEIYAVVLFGTLLLAAAVAIIRLLWPESSGGVHLLD